MSKPRQKVELATTDAGRQYACLTTPREQFWEPGSLARGSRHKLGAELARCGIYLRDQSDREQIAAMIAAATPYAGAPPIDQPGFSGPHFAFADGSIMSPPDAVPGPYIGEINASKRLIGSFEGWSDGVGGRLKGQHLPKTAVQLALAAPLVALGMLSQQPLIIELVLPNAAAGAPLMAIWRSILGQLSLSCSGALTFPDVLELSKNGKDLFRDLLHVVRDADLILAAASSASRRAQVSKFLCDAGQRSRPQSYILLNTRPMSDLVGAGTELATLIDARTIKLVLGTDRSLGVFDRHPAGEPDIASFSRSLEAAASHHQGHLMNSFISRLVLKLAQDEAGLREMITERIQVFKSRAGIDQHDGQPCHAANTFGLIYAAGWLAESWGLLPNYGHPGNSPRICLQTLLSRLPKSKPFDEELALLARDPETVHLGYGQVTPEPSMTRTAAVLVRHHKNRRELMVRSQAINRVFPNWTARLSTPEVQARLIREDTRIQVRRRLVAGEPQELTYSFRLPDLE
ncbi:hypothetical protein [Sphingomonas panaciterrae]|uniref:hypothetical protein n=1 Tax=Sphingomonas panaciterrae TaxID=1462999 RepID=UPI002FF28E22